MHPRRAYTVMVAAADMEGQRACAGVLLGHRNSLAGTSLAMSVPHRAALVSAGYPCLEDLGDPRTDTDPDDARRALITELVRHGLTGGQARDVVAHLFP